MRRSAGERPSRLAIGGRQRWRAVAGGAALIAATVLAVGFELLDPAATPAAASPITVSFCYSPEAEKVELLAPLIKAFNSEQHTLDGRRIIVRATTADGIASGEAMTLIAGSAIKPTAWSPADVSWGEELNVDRGHHRWAPANPRVLLRTATVIGMWETMAHALGYPRHQVGYRDIFGLARSGRGWAHVGRPDLGRFRFVHANPALSTSGLTGAVAENAVAAGRADLRIADVRDPATRKQVRAIERGVAHSADTTIGVTGQLDRYGRRYASAVVIGEATLMRFNRTRRAGSERLLAIYPAEGTYLAAQPFIVLNAPWVTFDQQLAASVFGHYLSARITPAAAAEHGFRPADPQARPPAALWRELGANVARQTAPTALPKPRVVAAIQDLWREDRKPANVLVVVDASGSMAKHHRLLHARRDLVSILDGIPSQDRIGLMAFSDRIRTLVKPHRFDNRVRRRITAAIDRVHPAGSTRLYDAISSAIRQLERGARTSDIDAVMLLTDANDTRSRLRRRELLTRLYERDARPQHVRVYAVAYARAMSSRLWELADATGGTGYIDGSLDPSAIPGDVYRDAASSS